MTLDIKVSSKVTDRCCFCGSSCSEGVGFEDDGDDDNDDDEDDDLTLDVSKSLPLASTEEKTTTTYGLSSPCSSGGMMVTNSCIRQLRSTGVASFCLLVWWK